MTDGQIADGGAAARGSGALTKAAATGRLELLHREGSQGISLWFAGGRAAAARGSGALTEAS